MNLSEPNIPSMPVNLSGRGRSASPEANVLRKLRDGSCYKGARSAVRLTVACGQLSVVTVMVYCFATRKGVTPWLISAASIVLMAVSFAAAEVGAAIFDIADARLHENAKDDSQG